MEPRPVLITVKLSCWYLVSKTSLGTSRMAVKPLERAFTAFVLVSRLVLETSQLFCWYPDSSRRLHTYQASVHTLLRDSTAILLVLRLFLKTPQLSCRYLDSSLRLYSYPAGPQTLPINSQLYCWYTDSSWSLTANLVVSRFVLET